MIQTFLKPLQIKGFRGYYSLSGNKKMLRSIFIYLIIFNSSFIASNPIDEIAFPIRQSAISKYALSRVDSNTEPMGDNPVIPF